MIGWLKRKAVLVAARIAGREVSMGAIGRFLTANKKTIAGVGVWLMSWAWYSECGVVAGIDILALIQRYFPSVICDGVQHALLVIAAFLAGAGVQDPQEWLTNFRKTKKPPEAKG